MRPVYLVSMFCLAVLLPPPVFAGALQSGPMVGYGEMREVVLWVQTTGPAEVAAVYWPKDRPEEPRRTASVITDGHSVYIAKLVADDVNPGGRYAYRIEIDGKAVPLDYSTEFQTPPQWKYRGEAPDFTLALGSCTYINEPAYDRPGKAYGADYKIFNSILGRRPDLMLWLGDNFYLREPDWNSWAGIAHRYTHGRSVPELQPLLASVHHYAILDDHDYGPNDSDRSFWNKEASLRAFDLFWANPSAGIADLKGAITFFEWSDVDFFLLDDRTYRAPNKSRTLEDKSLLGSGQLQWLKDALVSSDASFKVVALGGQFLNDAPVFETYANHGFARERQEILDFIRAENIRNVVFFTGDRHHTELSVWEPGEGPRVVDLTVSPLTAGPAASDAERNSHRVDGTLVKQRNFGLVRFSGPGKERSMEISIHDSDGRELWTRTIIRQH